MSPLSLPLPKRRRKNQTEVINGSEIDEEISFNATRTTRMHGQRDDNVSLSKENFAFWKITLCNERKKNSLTVKVSIIIRMDVTLEGFYSKLTVNMNLCSLDRVFSSLVKHCYACLMTNRQKAKKKY